MIILFKDYTGVYAMKIGFLVGLATLVLSSQSVFADQHVNGYTRSSGTSVMGYNRSSADRTATNNYSYRGNTNPYTGSTGRSTRLNRGDGNYDNSGNSRSQRSYCGTYDDNCKNRR